MTTARTTTAAALGCLLALTSAGCLSQEVRDRANRSTALGGMSHAELLVATRAAMRQARQEDATIRMATAEGGRGLRSGSAGQAHGCGSGRVLVVTLVGTFPHASSADGSPVTGERLTVDARTGRVCGSSVVTGPLVVDPNGALLFGG